MTLSEKVQKIASLIWSVADKLTGVYKPHEYGEVILPMTVLKRFDSALAATKQKVLSTLDTPKYQKATPELKRIFLEKESKYTFYNISQYDMKRLIDDPNNIEANLFDYIRGFSENVQEIIRKFKFEGHIHYMAEKGVLYEVVKAFALTENQLHPNNVSNHEMGYVFEELIRRFSEAHNEEAGQHYTPREVIRLMVEILFNDDNAALSDENTTKTIYDPACGTGGMLSVAEEHLKQLNHSLELVLFGQEINDQTFAICQSDMLIKGNPTDKVRNGNTLSEDAFPDLKFDYIISNPPFGREWKNEKTAIEREAKRGENGRFGIGLPPISDGQMLFLLTALSKMKDTKDGGSRVAIIHNGSPLFTGDAGSGPSEIRRYILENDLLEAIIALPNDIFYNTGIATYIWVLSNKKAGTRRAGKVQLINANQLYVKRRKSLGFKRNDIPAEAIEKITKVYSAFRQNDICKIFRNEDFGYTKVTVERPKRDENGDLVRKKNIVQPDTSLRDTENIPLSENIEEYFCREVRPFAPDAWIDHKKDKIGYEIPFTRYFYQYTPPQPADEIKAEILELSANLTKTMKEMMNR